MKRVKMTHAKSPSCSGRRNSFTASPRGRWGGRGMGTRPSIRAAHTVGMRVSAATAESSVQAVRPGANEWRDRHCKRAAQAEGDADGGVLQPLGDHLVDLGLDQDGRKGQPEEVAPEPEGAEGGVLQVPVVGRLGDAGDGCRHGRKAKLSRLTLLPETR